MVTPCFVAHALTLTLMPHHVRAAASQPSRAQVEDMLASVGLDAVLRGSPYPNITLESCARSGQHVAGAGGGHAGQRGP